MDMDEMIEEWKAELANITYSNEELEKMENELIKDYRFQEYMSQVKWW